MNAPRYALLAPLLVLAACSRQATEPRSSERARSGGEAAAVTPAAPARHQLTGIKIPALCTVNWSVARQKGYFRAEGLDVDLLPVDSSGHEHSISWVKGPAGRVRTDLTVIEHAALADVATGKLDYYVVAGEHSGCHQLVVPARSSVRTIADLKGKKIGIPAIEDTGPWEYLAHQAGLRRGALRWDYRPVPPGGPAEEADVRKAFADGSLDAFVTTDPAGEILKTAGLVRLVVSSTWTAPLRNWYCCMLGVRRALVDANPDLPRAVARAMRRAAVFVEQQPAAAVALGVESGQLSREASPELQARLLKEYVWSGTGRIEEDLERYFQMLVEAGRLPATASPRELVKRVYRRGE